MALPKNKNRDQRGRTMKKQRVIAAMLTLCLVVSAVGCSKKEISNEYVKISQYKGVEA